MCIFVLFENKSVLFFFENSMLLLYTTVTILFLIAILFVIYVLYSKSTQPTLLSSSRCAGVGYDLSTLLQIYPPTIYPFIKQESADSIIDCVENCHNDSTCKAATYVNSTKTCHKFINKTVAQMDVRPNNDSFTVIFNC